MTELLMGALLGLAAAAVLGLLLKNKMAALAKGPEVHIHSSIEEMRSLGELSVFKVITKEIVTARNHSSPRNPSCNDKFQIQ